MNLYLGVDPGAKGGFAVIAADGRLVGYDKFRDGVFLAGAIGTIMVTEGDTINRCYVEKAQSMPSQGVKSMFTYGTGYGKILGTLETMLLSYELVPPRKWQKKIIPGAPKGESKKAALIKAKQLFPTESFILKGCRKPHDGIIDAVLIAEYGRLLHQ